MMSSPFTPWLNLTIAGAICIALAIVAGVVANLVVRRLTNRLIRPAASQARTAQWREQQSRAMAEEVSRAGSGFVWAIVAVTVLAEFGVNVLPAVIVIAAAIVAVGIGARSLVADVVAGVAIIAEDQFAVGETIQVGSATGKVEQFTLRRTVLRDARGALVTLANGDVRGAGNLSRDWSQAFVDISIAAEEPLERAMQAMELASGSMRGDPSWSQAIVDGPRVLGVQDYGRAGPTLRIQVRTSPLRQDEVARELRRRIQLEFQRHHIEISTADELEQAAVFEMPEENSGPKISG
jgi:small-conductance mechanosensitive channel